MVGLSEYRNIRKTQPKCFELSHVYMHTVCIYLYGYKTWRVSPHDFPQVLGLSPHTFDCYTQSKVYGDKAATMGKSWGETHHILYAYKWTYTLYITTPSVKLYRLTKWFELSEGYTQLLIHDCCKDRRVWLKFNRTNVLTVGVHLLSPNYLKTKGHNIVQPTKTWCDWHHDFLNMSLLLSFRPKIPCGI